LTTATATSTAIVIKTTTGLVPTVTVSASQTTICSGTSVTFTASLTNGGTAPTYQWFVNGAAVVGATGSTFTSATLNNNDQVTVTMTSNAGCLTTNTATSTPVSMTVTAGGTPSVAVNATQTTICAGTSVTFTATPTNGGSAPTYQWSVNGAAIVGATGSTFTSSNLNDNDKVTVTMTSNSTCSTTTTAASTPVVITIATTINPTFDPIGPLCQNSIAPTLPATSKEGVTGTWSPSSISTAVVGQTQYTFTPTNNSCAIPPAPITIVVNQAASSITDTTICPNQLPFTWNGNVYQAAGTYQVSFNGSSGCDSIATLVLTVNTAFNNQRYDTVVTSPNTPTQLQARSIGNNSTYDWEPATGLSFSNVYNPVFNYDQNEDYIITISSGTGCIVHDSLTVLVNSPSNITSAIYVPLAWSPNGDGNNDKLTPLTVNIKTLNYFRVFNRWGQLMFETSTIGAGWDGMYNGKPQVSDAYTWTLEAIGDDGKTYKQSGTALLLR